MKKVLLTAILAVLALGCAITDYPVIFDTRGADDNGVMFGQYDLAYIIPSGQVATLWDDGSDELFTLVSQDWIGDQWLKTYDNFDPTQTIMFLDQTYCDPTYDKSFCAITVAWNPDIAGDDTFDYVLNMDCQGARSLSVLASMGSRLGECGSGVWADKQGLAYEFSLMDRVTFRNQSVYHLPIDSTVATFEVNGENAPIFGRYNMYVDQKLRLMVPVTPNFKYQLQWLDKYTQANGNDLDVNLTYGALNANLKLSITSVAGALDRI